MVILRAGVNLYCSSFMAKLSFFLFAINFPQRLRTAFKIAIYGSFQRLSPSLSGGTGGSRKGAHMCGIKKAFYTSPHEMLRARQPSKETNRQTERASHASYVKSFPHFRVVSASITSKRVRQRFRSGLYFYSPATVSVSQMARSR